MRFIECTEAQYNIAFHRRRLLIDIAHYLDIPIPASVLDEDEGETLRQELATLLSGTDWTKAMTAWIRQRAETADRKMFRLLACDGFKACVTSVKGLKEYLPNVGGSKGLVQKHARAVRQMYRWFDTEPSVCALTGLDSACVVFLSLIGLFKKRLGMNMDDQLYVVLNSAEISTQSFLSRRADTRFRDVSSVDDDMLVTLGRVYVDAFPEWESYFQELLNRFVVVWCSKDPRPKQKK
jgi:hypothetical protein